jgi:phosphate-selective porin OprO and OprP
LVPNAPVTRKVRGMRGKTIVRMGLCVSYNCFGGIEMHKRISQRLVWGLAVMATCGYSCVALGLEGPAPQGPSELAYSAPADISRTPSTAPSQFVSESGAADTADLAARVADLEKALKKAEEKAKEDKKKAAEKPTVTVFGRAMADTVAFGQDAQSQATYGDAKDSTYFRSARIGAMGDMFDVVSYKWEMDFASRDPQDLSLIAFKDTYLQIKELPLLQNVRVGHFKEPLSLEQLTSLKFVTFMERNIADTFVPNFDMGVMTFGCTESERATWAIGVFASGQDTPPLVTEDSTLTGAGTAGCARVTCLPWYDEATEGRGLLHVGLGYRYCELYSSTQRVRARPEVAVGPYVVDTQIGGVDTLTHVKNVQTANPEVAFVYGPFSVQSEYFAQTYTRTPGHTNPVFNGGYVYMSYFLTGESRAYNRKEGRFDRVKPFGNFFRVRDVDGNVEMGSGAWEVGYRYSWIDLNQGGILGGIASDHTFGINWYLNPYTRLMLDYVHSIDAPNNNQPGTHIDVLAMRAMFDF